MADRKGVMLAKPMDICRIEHWPKPFIAQPKLDGFRGRIQIWNTFDKPKIRMLSSSESLISSAPHIYKQFKALAKTWASIESYTEFDGEFYKHGMPFSNRNKTSISSIMSRTQNLHPEFEKIEFHAFDLKSVDVQMTRMLKLKLITREFDYTQSLRYVGYQMINSVDELTAYLSDCMIEGYEGIVVRHPQEFYISKKTYAAMKLKPRKTDEYKIVGANEEISKDGIPKDALGSFICEKDNQRFSVGSGPMLTKEGRKRMWEYRNLLINGNFKALIKYQYLTPGRDVPYGPVLMDVESIVDNGI